MPYPQVLLFTPHDVGGTSCGTTQASSVWLPDVALCNVAPFTVTYAEAPSYCVAALSLPVTPTVGHALPAHVAALPCPDASTNVVAPAGSSRCSHSRLLAATAGPCRAKT